MFLEVVWTQGRPQTQHRRAQLLRAEDARHRLDQVRLHLPSLDLIRKTQSDEYKSLQLFQQRDGALGNRTPQRQDESRVECERCQVGARVQGGWGQSRAAAHPGAPTLRLRNRRQVTRIRKTQGFHPAESQTRNLEQRPQLAPRQAQTQERPSQEKQQLEQRPHPAECE